MIAEVSPALILIVGAFLSLLVPRNQRGAVLLALPILAFAQLYTMPMGLHGQFEIFGLKLTTLRIDKLSLVFSYIFLVATALGIIFSLHEKDAVQQVAGVAYAGSALGAVQAGDLVTLFLYWEGTAITSVFLIWARRTEAAFGAGMRYIIIQVGSGVLLLAGIMLHYRATGSIAFETFGLDGSLANWLIFLAFGIKCAFPLLHTWLQDAYPEATVTGAVMLSAFTTKLAVYSLARGFAGTEILVPIGATMALFTIFYATIENDLRRVMAYALINQLGFMVVGVGIGTELAVNGAAAHAFTGILYKALLFMATGAVLYRTGTAKASELGGLFHSMPWTATFCAVGSASIAAVPLFAGFVSKSLIISAAMKGGYFWTWIILLAASAAAIHHAGLRLPYAAFFGRDSGKRCAEAPANMLVAMGLTAALCIGVGLFPNVLYSLLPYNVDYALYTYEHVMTQLQLLMLSVLVFAVLVYTNYYPMGVRGIVLDFDWFYRKAGANVLHVGSHLAHWAWAGITYGVRYTSVMANLYVHRHHGPEGAMGRTWPTGQMAFWATVMLGGYLVIAFWRQ